MRILICDDDEYVRKEIAGLIKEYFKEHKLEETCNMVEYGDGGELLSDYDKKDIIFLDIEMPNINGVTAGKKLREDNKDVIIFVVTSFSQYLDESMRFQIFRFLSKPIERERFIRNFDDAVKWYQQISLPVTIETKQGISRVDTKNILMVESRERKSIVYTEEREYESIQRFSYWVETLPAGSFVQTHRSFLVNMSHVKSFNHETVYLDKDALSAFLTKRKYNEFRKKFLLYLGMKH